MTPPRKREPRPARGAVPLWQRADIIENGHCCGCHAFPVTLYRAAPYVFRCASCFERQTGQAPAFDPNNAVRYNALPGARGAA